MQGFLPQRIDVHAVGTACHGFPPQAAGLYLQGYVALGELGIAGLEAHVRQHVCLPFEHASRHGVGLGEPYALLVVVELEEHDAREQFQQEEHGPMGIMCQTIQ